MAKLVIGTDKTVGVPAVVKEVERQEPYALLSRVKDDSNVEIGTVCGYQTDANNQKYAIVCLDSYYRQSNGALYSASILSSNVNDSDIVGYTFYSNISVWSCPETATLNCKKISDAAQTLGLTSSAISFCRNISFVIGGVTYYGQVPNLPELIKILMMLPELNTKDTTAASYPNAVIKTDQSYISSTLRSGSQYFYARSFGRVEQQQDLNYAEYVLPILEIPIN